MNVATSYSEFLEALRGHATFPGNYNPLPSSGAVGLLFVNPALEHINERILNNIDYYHERSGRYINFYFPGYYIYGGPHSRSDISFVGPNGDTWHFSNKLFVDFLCDFENHSKWKYSGEAELLLLDYDNGCLDLSNVIIINLENAVSDKSISTVYHLFEDIFRMARATAETNELGTRLMIRSGVEAFKKEVLDYLNQKTKGVAGKTLLYRSRNISNTPF